MTSEARKTSKSKYDAKTARYFSLKMNKNTDQDIIRKLESEPSVQGYLKRLIREDIEKNEK